MSETRKSVSGEDRTQAEPRTPAQSGSGGGSVATDVGSRDEEKTARGGDPEPTRATKQDKLQPKIPTRSDHEGAAR